MKMKMHAFAFGSKCGSFGAKGFTNSSDAVACGSRPSLDNIDPNAAMPSPLAVVFKNSLRFWSEGLGWDAAG